MKSVITPAGPAQSWREGAPGSRPAPDIPIRENDDTMYDNKYYDHDLRRNQKAKTEMQLPPRLALEQGMPQVSDGKRPAPPGSEEAITRGRSPSSACNHLMPSVHEWDWLRDDE